MPKKTFMNLNDININSLPGIENVNQESVLGTDGNMAVAIIGMSGRVGSAQDIDEFWNMLIKKQEGYGFLSENRQKDVNDYLRYKKEKLPIDKNRYLKGTLLEDIAGFDHRFFSLSLQEARRMDPNQRIFLETAWSALEDAGYIGDIIDGTDTGVYVGFSSDFGENYRRMIRDIEPDTKETAVVGNVNSIIASRISYQLNLKGPAILVNSACSSGLVAVYEAFKAIQMKECSMAIAGSVKCNPLPLNPDPTSSLGLKALDDTSSSDGHTRTFDNASDGTSHAEGAFAFILKPLDQAQKDGDHIRAVILGGAINQDGASNGITAPNMASQEELIKKAIKDAGVSVEDISYIEAHGTATRLGDPIEVGAIQRAFASLSSKKQFCAIGTAKTNIGHMDNASGAAGLAKVILSMEHRILPASLNFSRPNKNIAFIKSPVYVNDRLTVWGEDGRDVYAGINSFGLAGTNCHLILKSAPKCVKQNTCYLEETKLFTLSAKNIDSLKNLALRYSNCLNGSKLPIEDVLHTIYIGRKHYNTRLAILFHNYVDLCALLNIFANNETSNLCNENIMFGEFSVVLGNDQKKKQIDITVEEQKQLTRQATLISQQGDRTPTMELIEKLAKSYIRGATLPWNWLSGGECKRVALPTYPFTKTRCWIEIPESKGESRFEYDLLRNDCVEIPGCVIFTSMFNTESYWELNEHRISGVSVLPGTALIEIMTQAMCKILGSNLQFEFHDIVFERPFAVQDGKEKQLCIMVEDKVECKHIKLVSKDEDGSWLQHVSCTCYHNMDLSKSKTPLDFNRIKSSLNRNIEIIKDMETAKRIIVSDRWSKSCEYAITDVKGTEFLIKFKLLDKYKGEIQNYNLHPALMDISVNAINGLINEKEVFLPFSYGKLKVYQALPEEIYVHIVRKISSSENVVNSFDLSICDMNYNLVLEAENYCIKAITKFDILKNSDSKHGYKQFFEPVQLPDSIEQQKCMILAAGPDCDGKRTLVKELQLKGHEVFVFDTLSVSSDVQKVLEGKTFSFGFYYCNSEEIKETRENWQHEMDDSVYKALAFLRELSKWKINTTYGFTVLTQHAYKVLGTDKEIHPGQAAITGIWQVVALENEHLNLRCIDSDTTLQGNELVKELLQRNREQLIAYRGNRAYVPVIKAYKVPQIESIREIDSDGVIIISGGTGSLGTYLAQHLVEKGFRRIVLMGKHLQQKNEVWDKLAKQCDVFEVYGVPIESYDLLEERISEIRDSFGYIQGVFHLAGRPGDGYLYNKTDEVFHDVYDSKAIGAMNLHLATRKDKLNYFVMYSSIASLVIKAGQSDYTGANIALDAFAEYRTMLGLPALSIQWPAWKEIGMAQRMGAIKEDEGYPPISPKTAMDLLDRILWNQSEDIHVIMPGKRMVQNSKKHDNSNNIKKNVSNVMLDEIDQPDEIEQTVANIWGITLGINEVSIHDEFNDLGGNSILTSQILKEFDKKFPKIMEITDLFSYTTIHTQSQYIKSKIKPTSTRIQSNDSNFDRNLDGNFDRNLDDLLNKKLDDILEQVEKGEISVAESTKLL